MSAKKFGFEGAMLGAALAGSVAGCENLPKVSIDFRTEPTSEQLALSTEKINKALTSAEEGNDIIEGGQDINTVILTEYMEVMGNCEARVEFRQKILRTAGALHESGSSKLSWELLTALEEANNYFIKASEETKL